MPDFVKESLFERLQHYLADKHVADIFAGTGTIGLEAMSRGAKTAIFIEQDPKAVVLLKKNIAMLGVEAETMCWPTDVFRCSFRPKNVETLLPCDVVFMDPPYKMVEGLHPGAPLFKSFERIARPEFTASDALLVFRTPTRVEFQLPACWEPWSELPQVEFSSMVVYLYQKVASAEPAPASIGEAIHDPAAAEDGPIESGDTTPGQTASEDAATGEPAS